MKTKIFRYSLLILILAPLLIIFFGEVNPSGYELLAFLSIVPAIGLWMNKKWFFYYVYVGVGFILASFIFMIGLFISYVGWGNAPFLLYFLIILTLTIVLHKDYINKENLKKSQISSPPIINS